MTYIYSVNKRFRPSEGPPMVMNVTKKRLQFDVNIRAVANMMLLGGGGLETKIYQRNQIILLITPSLICNKHLLSV